MYPALDIEKHLSQHHNSSECCVPLTPNICIRNIPEDIKTRAHLVDSRCCSKFLQLVLDGLMAFVVHRRGK